MHRSHSRSGLFFTIGLILCVAAIALNQGRPRLVDAGAFPAWSIDPASACDVPARSADGVLALLPPPSDEPPAVTLAPAMPPGEPADPMTVDAVSAVVQTLEACLNTGDPLKFYALLSDDWFRDLQNADDVRAELAAMATTPPAPRDPGYRETFVGPWHVMTLEDQRVLAAVVWFGSEDDLRLDPRLTHIVIFVEQNGRWLVDDIIARVYVPECGHSVKAGVVVGPPPGATLAGPALSCEDVPHEEKETVRAQHAEREARVAGTTTFIPAAVVETVPWATPAAR